jgi:hypothetical protein
LSGNIETPGKENGATPPEGKVGGDAQIVPGGELWITVCVCWTTCVCWTSTGAENCVGLGIEIVPPQPAMFTRFACAWSEVAVPDWITCPFWDAFRSKTTSWTEVESDWFTV